MKDNYKKLMNKKYLLWIFGAVLALFVGLPTVALGDSFISSLIQGKTPAEAVTIIADQVDQLLGRVTTLENGQVQSNGDIEHLKLENENLRLQNEILSKEASSTAQEVAKNKEDTKTVSECASLEHQLYCPEQLIPTLPAIINQPLLPGSASISDVSAIWGSTWYASSTGQICIKISYGNLKENCHPLSYVISQINADRTQQIKSAQRNLDDANKIIQQYKPRYDDLKCDALLQEYAPARQKPGCG